MLDIVDVYLRQKSNPVFRDMIADAFNVLESFGLDDFEKAFEELVLTSNNDDVDDGDVIFNIDNLTRRYLKQLLKDHGLIVSVETSIRQMTIFLRAILGLNDSEYGIEITEICHSDADDLDKTCRLLAMHCEIEAEEIALDLTDVEEGFIEKVKDLYENSFLSQEDTIDSFAAKKYLTDLRLLLKYIKVDDIRTSRLVRAGTPVGLDFTSYIGKHGESLATIPENNIVIELYASALISKDGSTQPIEKISEHIEVVIGDVKQTSEALRKLRILHTGFNDFKMKEVISE